MSDNIIKLEEICKTLSQSISENSWAILTNDQYILVISDELGVAVVTFKDIIAAKKGAMEVTREAAILGFKIQAYPFIVSERKPGDSDMFINPGSVVKDIKDAMGKRNNIKPVMTLEDAEGLMAMFWDGNQVIEQKIIKTSIEKKAKKSEVKPLSPEFRRMLVACADRALGSNKPWVAGVEITVEQLVSDDFLLGPLLLVASENWTPPYLKSKQQGGFMFSIAHDPEKATIGYRVTGIHMASPLIVLTAVSAAIRKQSRKGACILDPYLLRFAHFIDEIKASENMPEDVDTMMVESSK